MTRPSIEGIYRQYFGFVWASVKRLGVDAETDDVVQDVFIVVHCRLHTLQRAESLQSWLYGIVRRTVSSYWRTQRATLALEARTAEEGATPEPSPLELMERASEVELLRQLTKQLDAAKREVFLLVEVDEMTVPEAASALELPLNTAYSRLRAARFAFDQALARTASEVRGRRGEPFQGRPAARP